ncbi:MAG: LD-carboxypeptidase [Bacillota bacterium]|nr:LD-carboxypeptidase [Bacillota bacterium]
MMKVGMLGLSNPIKKERIQKEKEWLEAQGIVVEISPLLFQESSGKERAEVFNTWVQKGFDYLFDVSGGDLANETIPYLDYEAYKNSSTIYFGYSDLTCVINALYTKTKKSSILFSICANKNKNDISDFLFNRNEKLLENEGKKVLGGNIRCFLKLAGSPYFPNLKDQTLFLESYSGNERRIRAYFAQLYTMGVFHEISSLILGQFTEMEESGEYGKVVDIAKSYFPNVEIQKNIGHSRDSKGLRIG